MFGSLLSAGHDINTLIDGYTLEQIAWMSSCLTQHQTTRLNVVQWIASAMLGFDDKKGKASASKAPKQKRDKDLTPQEAEFKQMQMLSGLEGLMSDIARLPSSKGRPKSMESLNSLQRANAKD